MVNKKGYIKTLEAVIAIIIIVIISYTLIAQPTETPPDVPSIVKGAQNVIDQTIQLNETIRTYLAKKDLSGGEKMTVQDHIGGIIDKQVPPGYDYTCLICSKPGECLAEYTPLEKSVYMTDVLIASSEGQQNVRIVRIWFWRKPTTEQEQSKIIAYNSCTTK
jgi:hypothetical protein